MDFQVLLENKRQTALAFYQKSEFPDILKKTEALLNGSVIEGREGLGSELIEDLGWPLSQDSVVFGFFWGTDDRSRGEHLDSAIGIEVMPDGTIYVHGGGIVLEGNIDAEESFPFGTSVLPLSSWRGNRELQLKAFQKAYDSPRIINQD